MALSGVLLHIVHAEEPRISQPVIASQDLSQFSLRNLRFNIPDNVKIAQSERDLGCLLSPEFNGVIFPSSTGKLSDIFRSQIASVVSLAPKGAKNWGRTELNALRLSDLAPSVQSILGSYGLRPTKAEMNFIVERISLAFRMVSSLTDGKTVVNGRLCLGPAGLGERYHDDANNIVATVALSGPGTRYVASRNTDTVRGSNGSHQTVMPSFTESQAFECDTGDILVMRGTFFGNSNYRDGPPLLPIPGLVHRKPDRELCSDRLCFVVYTKFGNQEWCAAKTRFSV